MMRDQRAGALVRCEMATRRPFERRPRLICSFDSVVTWYNTREALHHAAVKPLNRNNDISMIVLFSTLAPYLLVVVPALIVRSRLTRRLLVEPSIDKQSLRAHDSAVVWLVYCVLPIVIAMSVLLFRLSALRYAPEFVIFLFLLLVAGANGLGFKSRANHYRLVARRTALSALLVAAFILYFVIPFALAEIAFSGSW